MDRSELILSRRARGREIFRKYLRKYLSQNFSSDEEKAYICAIIESSDYHPGIFDVPIPRWKFYVPLEKAERTKGHIVIEPSKESAESNKSEGWTYKIKVRKGPFNLYYGKLL